MVVAQTTESTRSINAPLQVRKRHVLRDGRHPGRRRGHRHHCGRLLVLKLGRRYGRNRQRNSCCGCCAAVAELRLQRPAGVGGGCGCRLGRTGCCCDRHSGLHACSAGKGNGQSCWCLLRYMRSHKYECPHNQDQPALPALEHISCPPLALAFRPPVVVTPLSPRVTQSLRSIKISNPASPPLNQLHYFICHLTPLLQSQLKPLTRSYCMTHTSCAA